MPAPAVVQNWQSYSLDLDGRLAVRSVNLGLKVQAPLADMPYLLTAWIKSSRTDAHGQPTDKELRTFARIDELLEREVRQRFAGLFVGHQTRNGIREYYFYCPHTEGHAQAISQIITAFDGYAHGSIARPDAPWSHYFDTLYPSPSLELSIRNQNTVESLNFFGDPLTPPRAIDHFLYFGTEEGRNQFIDQVTQQGFTVLRTNTYASADRMPYSVLISRADSAVFEHVDAVVHQLAAIAQAFGGEYDGWESALVEAPSPVSGLADSLLSKLEPGR